MRIDISYNGCSCWLNYAYWHDVKIVMLYGLYTDPKYRKQGSAKAVIRFIKKWANKKNEDVYLFIGPFMDKPMSHEQLFEFYSKMGFEVIYNIGTIYMKYVPKIKVCKKDVK